VLLEFDYELLLLDVDGEILVAIIDVHSMLVTEISTQ
jgi:hypothetical protein